MMCPFQYDRIIVCPYVRCFEECRFKYERSLFL